jgi:monoamine oxidase
VGTTESRPDVVIVGGGFAGVTAARELTMRGRSAVLVEARDRLGGRTYTSDHDGHAMELGGTGVHPLQPHAGPRSAATGWKPKPSRCYGRSPALAERR